MSKKYDIQWPVSAQTVEAINANFDALFGLVRRAGTTADAASAKLAATPPPLPDPVTPAHGGTGLTSVSVGGLLAGAPGNLLALVPVGTNGQVLSASTASTAGVAWTTPLPDPVTVTHGGTGLTTVSTGGVLVGVGPSTFILLPVGADGQVLSASSASTGGVHWLTPPAPLPDPLTVAHGGIGLSSVSTGGILLGIGPTTFVVLPVGADGQTLKASSVSTGGVKWDTPAPSNTTASYVVLGAAGDLANSRILVGTSSQVIVTAGSASVVLSLPQDIATGSVVQFGEVGIGAAPGDQKLLISADQMGFRFLNTGGVADEKIWDFYPQTNGTAGGILHFRALNDVQTLEGAWLEVQRNPGSQTIKQVTFPNGKVGIGTSSPSQALEVVGITKVSQYFIASGYNFGSLDTAGEGNILCGLEVYDGTGELDLGVTETLHNAVMAVGGYKDLIFANYSGGYQEKVRITKTGSVGIGTAAPTNVWSKTLQVYQESNCSLSVKTAVAEWHLGVDATGSLFHHNGDHRLTILSSGKVGIGTTTPGSKLSVVGLPTSSAGLSTGDIWVDTTGGLNILKIV